MPANGSTGEFEELKLEEKGAGIYMNESSELDFSSEITSQRSEITASTEDNNNYPRESLYVKQMSSD